MSEVTKIVCDGCGELIKNVTDNIELIPDSEYNPTQFNFYHEGGPGGVAVTKEHNYCNSQCFIDWLTKVTR